MFGAKFCGASSFEEAIIYFPSVIKVICICQTKKGLYLAMKIQFLCILKIREWFLTGK